MRSMPILIRSSIGTPNPTASPIAGVPTSNLYAKTQDSEYQIMRWTDQVAQFPGHVARISILECNTSSIKTSGDSLSPIPYVTRVSGSQILSCTNQ